jgi:2-(1,2-epoxy-1,2-dihydrophenyl)acetyl-CoA isomerase
VTYEFVELEREGPLATIRLNRPKAFNALHVPLVRELCDAVIAVDVDPLVRGVLLTANGPAFSGGGDVKGFVAAGEELPALIHHTTLYLHAMVSRLIRMSKPVVTAVNGIAAGAGFSLAMLGDIVLAKASAQFTLAYTRIGASPDGSSTFFLSRIVGLRRALELVYTNRVLSAQEALDWGLITRVLPDEGFEAAAKAVALELAHGPTLALGRAKDLIYHSQNHNLEAQMERETQGIVASSKTEDFRNGTRAFVDKRPTTYQGR